MNLAQSTMWTKGRWEADGLCIRARGRGTIANVPTPQGGGVVECSANVNLIAAAPDIYATAAHLLDMIDAQERDRTPPARRETNDDANSRDERDQVFGDATERLRAALAKARGETK